MSKKYLQGGGLDSSDHRVTSDRSHSEHYFDFDPALLHRLTICHICDKQ